jgi:hypothetical protein
MIVSEHATTDQGSSHGLPAPPSRTTARPHLAWRIWRAVDLRRDVLLAPLGGAIVLGFLARPGDPVRTALLSVVALAGGALIARRAAAQATLLPLMRHVYPLLGPMLGLAAIGVLQLLTGNPDAASPARWTPAARASSCSSAA